MRVTKQTIVKDDGRLLTYYWFDRRPSSVPPGTRKPEGACKKKRAQKTST